MTGSALHAPISARRRWLAMRVKEPHKENLARLWLDGAGITALVPMEVKSYRQRRGKRRRGYIERPALRGYVFVAVLAGEDWREVKNAARARVPWLARPVSFGGHTLLIHEGWEGDIPPELLDPEGLLRTVTPIVVGEVVQLNEEAGLYCSYSGTVEAVSESEVKLLVDGLHAALRFSVPLSAIKRAA